MRLAGARQHGADEPGGPTEGARAAAHPNLALAVVVVGVLITAVDTTIVVLALPDIQRSLHVGLASVIWVIIGYLLVITLLSTQVGRLGDLFGRLRMYEAGFVVFVAGSLACALSWNELSLVGFRLLQGVGGALIAANSGAVIADTFPPEQRGRAYGMNSIGFNTGAVLGVVLGGVIVTFVSWRWIFGINVPIGLAAAVGARRVLVDSGRRQQRRLDWWGMVTLGIGLFGLLWAMVKLTSQSLDLTIAGWLVGGAVVLVVFWGIERTNPAPMLDLDLFRVPTMTPSLLAALFQSLANFAVLFLLLMYLQGVRHLSPLLAYAQLGLRTPLWFVVVAYVVGAVGSGCFFPSNNSAVMKAAPGERFGTASGLLRTFANVGMVFSFALAILVASATITKHEAFAIFVGTTTLRPSVAGPFTDGIHAAFYSSTSLMVVAALLSASRARPRRHQVGPPTGAGRGAPAGP
ncbi:MAG: MFS transporter [Acidimicrobiales bacterium]